MTGEHHPPPEEPVEWRITWHQNGIRHWTWRVAQTDYDAWEQVRGAPPFSVCTVQRVRPLPQHLKGAAG
jgi:hypothetical protein